MNQKYYVAVSGVVFLAVAVLHGARILLGWNVVINEWSAPLWASWLAICVAGYLAVSAFQLSKRT